MPDRMGTEQEERSFQYDRDLESFRKLSYEDLLILNVSSLARKVAEKKGYPDENNILIERANRLIEQARKADELKGAEYYEASQSAMHEIRGFINEMMNELDKEN